MPIKINPWARYIRNSCLQLQHTIFLVRDLSFVCLDKDGVHSSEKVMPAQQRIQDIKLLSFNVHLHHTDIRIRIQAIEILDEIYQSNHH